MMRLVSKNVNLCPDSLTQSLQVGAGMMMGVKLNRKKMNLTGVIVMNHVEV